MENIKLEEMLETQKKFTRSVLLEMKGIDINKGLTYKQECDLIKDVGLSIIDEVLETVRNFDWKMHKKPKNKTFDRDEVLEEMVDQFKFWMNQLVILEYSIDDFKKMWLKKTQIVASRFDTELSNEK